MSGYAPGLTHAFCLFCCLLLALCRLLTARPEKAPCRIATCRAQPSPALARLTPGLTLLGLLGLARTVCLSAPVSASDAVHPFREELPAEAPRCTCPFSHLPPALTRLTLRGSPCPPLCPRLCFLQDGTASKGPMAHSDVLGSAIPEAQQMELQKAICSLLGMVGDVVRTVISSPPPLVDSLCCLSAWMLL